MLNLNQTEKRINLGILAHVDAGKTTVTEGLLVHSGAKRRWGRVDDGTTTTDSMAVERQRGMTVRAATVSFRWKGAKINLIDTPGHMDFIAEVERSLAVLDGAVLVISAREGVQPQTRVIFDKLRTMRIPTLLYINKIDRIGACAEDVLSQVRARLTRDILPVQRVDGEGSRDATVEALNLPDIADTIIEKDDHLLAAYLAGDDIGPEALQSSLRAQVRAGLCYPVLFGAALHDIGVEPLLDAITACFAAPAQWEALPLSAYIYKVEWNAYDHKLAYLRVLSGLIEIRSRIGHPGHDQPVHVKGLMGVVDGQLQPVASISAGDIGVLMDAPYVRCGDFLGEVSSLPGVTATEPLLTIGIEPGEGVGRNALLNALQRLTEEDPLLRMAVNAMTDEITLRLFGVLQREIIDTLLRERFALQAIFTPVRTLMKAKPRQQAFAETRIFRPGNLHQAGIALTVEPLPTGSGLQYETRVSYGDLEKSFQNAVEEGVMTGLAEGLGDALVDTKVTFVDMDYSSVTSTPADFRRLAPLVLRDALKEAGLDRFEPWMRLELTAPLSAQKKVLSALNRLRAVIQNVRHTEEECIVQGEAPLDTIKDFAASLQAMTQGQGLFDLTFLAYRQA